MTAGMRWTGTCIIWLSFTAGTVGGWFGWVIFALSLLTAWAMLRWAYSKGCVDTYEAVTEDLRIAAANAAAAAEAQQDIARHAAKN